MRTAAASASRVLVQVDDLSGAATQPQGNAGGARALGQMGRPRSRGRSGARLVKANSLVRAHTLLQATRLKSAELAGTDLYVPRCSESRCKERAAVMGEE